MKVLTTMRQPIKLLNERAVEEISDYGQAAVIAKALHVQFFRVKRRDVARALVVPPCYPSVVTICYSAAVSACEKSHEWQLALDLFIRMAEAKVGAKTSCYSAAISACEKTRVATRIGLAQQNGGSKAEADTNCPRAQLRHRERGD